MTEQMESNEGAINLNTASFAELAGGSIPSKYAKVIESLGIEAVEKLMAE